MKLLLRCNQIIEAGHLAGVLRAAGVRCEVRNTTLSGAVGEIPWLECAPQLWILDDADEARALEVIAAARRAPGGPAWRCSCGETLEAQFGACWNCGALRPPDA